MRRATNSVNRAAMLRLRRFLALTLSLFFLVSSNSAIAHGANGSGGAPPVVPNKFGPHHGLGKGPGANVNPVSFNPFATSSFTPAQNTHIPHHSSTVGLGSNNLNLDLSSQIANIVLGA